VACHVSVHTITAINSAAYGLQRHIIILGDFFFFGCFGFGFGFGLVFGFVLFRFLRLCFVYCVLFA